MAIHDGGDYLDQRFPREDNCSFRDRIDVAGKPEIFEIGKEIFCEQSGRTKIADVLFIKMQVIDILDDLIKASAYGIAGIAGICTEKGIKNNGFVGVFFFKISLHHG